jgi:hypothetical protein
MPEPQRRGWLHGLAGALGAIIFLTGIFGLTRGLSLGDSLFAVLGFLIMSWAALDYRRFRRGTPESEVGGGRTIE